MLDKISDALGLSAKPVVDDNTAQWIVDCFDWALEHCDADFFFNQSELVQPNNDYFPGRFNSVEQMASELFSACLKYTGLAHWPFKLQDISRHPKLQVPQLGFEQLKRSQDLFEFEAAVALPVPFHGQQINNTEHLAANYSHVIAQHIVQQLQLPVPGGEALMIEASEVLAVYLNFGVMLANSAYSYRGSCARCFNAAAQRQGVLAESELTFALAIYAELKSVDNKTVFKHLKPHLKPTFKAAKKQLVEYQDQLNLMRQRNNSQSALQSPQG